MLATEGRVGDADGREEETGREKAKRRGAEADGHRSGAEKNKKQTNKNPDWAEETRKKRIRESKGRRQCGGMRRRQR